MEHLEQRPNGAEHPDEVGQTAAGAEFAKI